MKKFMVVLLALVMVLGMSVSAFASEDLQNAITINIELAEGEDDTGIEDTYYTNTEIVVSGQVTTNKNTSVTSVNVNGDSANVDNGTAVLNPQNKVIGYVYEYDTTITTPSTPEEFEITVTANLANRNNNNEQAPITNSTEVTVISPVTEGVEVSGLTIKQDNKNNTVLWGTVTETYIGEDGNVVVNSYERAFPLQKSVEKEFEFEVNGTVYTQTVSKSGL